MPGKLFIVGTPIGNLEDITLRALRVLREADIIAAEDTRRTAQLLTRHGIALHFARLEPLVGPRCSAANSDTQQRVPTGGASVVRGCPDPAEVGPRCSAANVDTQQRVPTGAANSDTQQRVPTTKEHGRRLVSYHEFNEAKRTQELLKELQQGRTVALVTDAGMPTISDPGQRLIQAVVEWNEGFDKTVAAGFSLRGKDAPVKGAATGETALSAVEMISLEIIPGPSAVTMALAASGLGGPHLFYGFLPHKSGQRGKALTRLAPLPFTLVFFESPYRVIKSLGDMLQILGNRRAVVARELTKKFEEIVHGDLASILKKLENRSIKGEITVVVEGNKE